MSLFSDLPAPVSESRGRDVSAKEEQTISTNVAGETAKKKRRVEEDNSKQSVFLSGEQLSSALDKIANHIGKKDKFVKACSLYRQILDSGAITTLAREKAMRVMKEAFQDFETPTQPLVRREYMKLCHTMKKHYDFFTRPEIEQLEVYYVAGFIQNELFTDDNFNFNKVINNIKELISALPPILDEDEEERFYRRLSSKENSNDSNQEKSLGAMAIFQKRSLDSSVGKPPATSQNLVNREAGEQREPVKDEANLQVPVVDDTQSGALEKANFPEDDEGEEADPFGLGHLMAKDVAAKTTSPSSKPPALDYEASWSWSESQCRVMRREALLSCVHSAKTSHRLAWARTSVELLIDHVVAHRALFCAGQRACVDSLALFVRDQRLSRAQGPDARERRRDETSFERAQAMWAGARISNRGKVGASHDAKANNWLG